MSQILLSEVALQLKALALDIAPGALPFTLHIGSLAHMLCIVTLVAVVVFLVLSLTQKE